MSSIKQYIIIRRDLKMRRGKEIAQGSHAAMMFMRDHIKHSAANKSLALSDTEETWLIEGMAKICLQVSSEEDLIAIHEKAKEAGLQSFLVRDSGKTEFAGQPTLTCCAIGPDFSEKIAPITQELKLY